METANKGVEYHWVPRLVNPVSNLMGQAQTLVYNSAQFINQEGVLQEEREVKNGKNLIFKIPQHWATYLHNGEVNEVGVGRNYCNGFQLLFMLQVGVGRSCSTTITIMVKFLLVYWDPGGLKIDWWDLGVLKRDERQQESATTSAMKCQEIQTYQYHEPALTGESLPGTKHGGDGVYSGSTCKQGEIEAVVIATGVHTFFGKAAHLVENTTHVGHFQKVLTSIGNFCVCSIAIGMIIEIIVIYGVYGREYRVGIDNLLVLLIGGIPIAMATVLSITMAIGSHRLSQQGAITKRMTAIEEMAEMDVLCRDRTGTLTLNKLSVDKNMIEIFAKGVDKDMVVLMAARASRLENQDAIECEIISMLADPKEARNGIKEVHFLLFNPTDKRTTLTYIDANANGGSFSISRTTSSSYFKLWDLGRTIFWLLEDPFVIQQEKVVMAKQVEEDMKVLIQWKQHPTCDNPQELRTEVVKEFLSSHLVDKVNVEGEGVDEDTVNEEQKGRGIGRLNLGGCSILCIAWFSCLKPWDPGGNYYTFYITWSLCFQLWDPGGRPSSLLLSRHLHLEDKVNFKGGSIDRNVEQTNRFGEVFVRRGRKVNATS